MYSRLACSSVSLGVWPLWRNLRGVSFIHHGSEPLLDHRAPPLPRGAVRGCSYMKLRAEGRFSLSPGWSPTPPNSMLNRLSSSRGSPWCFYFFERIRFQDFFYFFVEKTLLLMKNQHFIIIITFHQITHQLVLSIFTWDFIFSSKLSL